MAPELDRPADRDSPRGALNSQDTGSSDDVRRETAEPADSGALARLEDGPHARVAPALPRAGPGPVWLNQYRLDRVVGAGGMGVVHDAWDDALKRRVAVKVLAHGAPNKGSLDRFRQEATLAGRLHHPNVVVVYEAGEANGRAFIAMEFVEGRTLEEEIQARTGDTLGLSDEERECARRTAVAGVDVPECKRIARLLRDVALALHAGHVYRPYGESEPRPIVHRDVKPGNVIVDGAHLPKLLDYGLAKEVGLTLTFSREAVGTPLYMSPEQLFSSKRVGPRTDVYSLGMTLYACLTLARPFELSQPGKLFEHLLHDDPTSVRKLNPKVPEDLDTIFRKATEKDERNRYPTALALAEDLDAFLEDRPIRARKPGLARTVRRWVRRHATVSSVFLVLLLGGAAVAWKANDDAFEAAQAEQAATAQRWSEAGAHRNNAEGDFRKAALLFQLASLVKGEDPEGDRWMQLLNQGHDLEAAGTREVSAATVGADPPSLKEAHLLARVARNDRTAEDELAHLARAARAAGTRAQSCQPYVTWLEARAAEPGKLEVVGDAIRFLKRPWTSAMPAGNLDFIEALITLFPRETDFDAAADPATEYAGIVRRVGERYRSDVALGAGAASYEAALEGLKSQARVAVSWPQAARGSGSVELVRSDADRRPTVTIARGAPGEVLGVVPGDLLVRASQPGARPVQVALRVTGAAWGAAQDLVDFRLPVAPSSVPAGMVLVSSGNGEGFFLDAEEVSNARYAEFLDWVKAHGHGRCCPPRPGESETVERAGFDAVALDHRPRGGGSLAPEAPVTGVSWDNARAFAAWAGSRLPTRDEWLQAVSAGRSSLAGANFRGLSDGWLWASPTSEGPCAVCGAVNLVGNVAQWVACAEDELPYREAVGGGWNDAPSADPRALVARYARGARGADVGFRCARSLPDADPVRVAEPPARIVSPIDHAALLLVPGGSYQHGGWIAGPRGAIEPVAQVELRSFYVDESPVSNARFDAFLKARSLPQPPGFAERLADEPDAPARGVSWTGASAFAAWAGKRLPTEAEYEVALHTLASRGAAEAATFAHRFEWCADYWSADFWRITNRRAPWNRWPLDPRHVVRKLRERGAYDDGSPSLYLIGFRCVQDAALEDGR